MKLWQNRNIQPALIENKTKQNDLFCARRVVCNYPMPYNIIRKLSSLCLGRKRSQYFSCWGLKRQWKSKIFLKRVSGSGGVLRLVWRSEGGWERPGGQSWWPEVLELDPRSLMLVSGSCPGMERQWMGSGLPSAGPGEGPCVWPGASAAPAPLPGLQALSPRAALGVWSQAGSIWLPPRPLTRPEAACLCQGACIHAKLSKPRRPDPGNSHSLPPPTTCPSPVLCCWA